MRHAEQTAAAAAATEAYKAYHARLEGRHKKSQDAHVLFSDAASGGEPPVSAEVGGEDGKAGGDAVGGGMDAAAPGCPGAAADAGGGAAGGALLRLEMPDMVYRVEPALMAKAEEGPELRLQYLPTGHVVSTGPTLAPVTISRGGASLVFTTSDHQGEARKPEVLTRQRAEALAEGAWRGAQVRPMRGSVSSVGPDGVIEKGGS